MYLRACLWVSFCAGDVIYSIEGFLEKNKDTLFQDIKTMFYNAKLQTLKDMWPEGTRDRYLRRRLNRARCSVTLRIRLACTYAI